MEKFKVDETSEDIKIDNASIDDLRYLIKQLEEIK